MDDRERDETPLVGRRYEVLDRGFVTLIDCMGDDAAIADAARVTRGYEGGERSHEADRRLIRSLYRRRHTSPFEMVEFKFHVKLPLFVARQWIRHRTASVNELSGRKKILPEYCRFSADDVRPGPIGDTLSDEAKERFSNRASALAQSAQECCETAVDEGVAREQARTVLPLSAYTQWYWKIDLHNLFNFLALRLSAEAQYEIRRYAEVIQKIVQTICPIAYEAFVDYRRDAMTLSALEVRALSEAEIGDTLTADRLREVGLSEEEIPALWRKVTMLTEKYGDVEHVSPIKEETDEAYDGDRTEHEQGRRNG